MLCPVSSFILKDVSVSERTSYTNSDFISSLRQFFLRYSSEEQQGSKVLVPKLYLVHLKAQARLANLCPKFMLHGPNILLAY